MKTDGRVRYTKAVIKESLLKLLAEKPIQKVTVTEICELAQINRATFYTHYHDPFHALEQIENELFEDFSAAFKTRDDDIDHFTEKAFLVIEKNMDLCRVLFSENGDKLFMRRIMEIAREGTIADWQRQYPRATQRDLDFLYTFLVSGSVALIEQWVRSGMREAPLELGEIAKKVRDSWLQDKK